jgi:hypothetical protein
MRKKLYGSTNIESILNALLLNASELKNASDDPLASAELSSQEEGLLSDLFNAWNSLTEEEKKNLLTIKVESKVLELAKKTKSVSKKSVSIFPHEKHLPAAPNLILSKECKSCACNLNLIRKEDNK